MMTVRLTFKAGLLFAQCLIVVGTKIFTVYIFTMNIANLKNFK